jgi:hypothetical protein
MAEYPDLVTIAVRQIKDFVDNDPKIQAACDEYVGRRIKDLKYHLTHEAERDAFTTWCVDAFFSRVYTTLIIDGDN